MLLPVLDALLIAFHRAGFRSLHAEVQLAQKLADVIVVVPHTEGMPDQFTDAFGGPTVIQEAVSLRTEGQQAAEQLCLVRAEFAWSSVATGGFECVFAVARSFLA